MAKRKTADDIDLEADALTVVAPDQQLKEVARLAELQSQLTGEVLGLEDTLKERKEALRLVSEQQLPEAMDACNMKEFALKNGLKVTVESIIAGSIPKANETEALAWLRANKHDGLIKKAISVALARGQDALGDKVVAQLKKLGVDVVSKDSVHPQTLGAWAREMLRGGKAFPAELLGIYQGRRTKLVAPKV